MEIITYELILTLARDRIVDSGIISGKRLLPQAQLMDRVARAASARLDAVLAFAARVAASRYLPLSNSRVASSTGAAAETVTQIASAKAVLAIRARVIG